MLSYNEIKKGSLIILNDEPFEVLESTLSKKSRQKASNQTKLKNLKNGSVIAMAFHQSDNVKEVDIEKRKIVFIYKKGDIFVFHEKDNKSKRFELDKSKINGAEFIAENQEVEAKLIDEEIILVSPPIKVDLEVVDAPPSTKGNTAQGGTKKVTLETGATINVPLFIKEKEKVKINTTTGEYVERSK